MGELSPALPRFTEFQLPSPLLINASNPLLPAPKELGTQPHQGPQEHYEQPAYHY
jgi:hypothetical protein